MEEIKEIDNIEFGILSPEDILKMSVVEVTKNRLSTNNDYSKLDTLYDPRLGPMDTNATCITCSLKTKDCSGHFGHIVLNVPVIHPLYYRTIVNFLKCVCIQCSKLLISVEKLELLNLMRLKGESRFNQILTYISKISFCMNCQVSQPKYTLSTQDGVFMASYKIDGLVEKIVVSTFEIQKILSCITDDDIRLLGFDPSRTHPKNLVLTIFPVLPPRSRPFIISDNIICNDDLTIALSEIIKANNNLKSDNISEIKRNKYIQNLNFRIKTYLDNSSGRAKHTNSRPLKGHKERLSGKKGLIRSSLLGKRTEMSARTVIGPDPTLRLNEVGVPHEIADSLSFPEIVNKYNIEYLQNLVWNDKVNIIDKVLNENEKPHRIYIKYTANKEYVDKLLTLNIGDVVHRKLQDGDRFMFDRQPTLHKGGILGMKVKRMPGKTFRMNLAITASYNADHDGKYDCYQQED